VPAAIGQSLESRASSLSFRCFAINARSKDRAAFQKSIRKIATPERENVFAILMAKVKKDPSKMTNPESIVYSMTVKDPVDYVAHRQRTSTEQSN
jgi:hypothetical protein|tara:strand:- start:412 stop:696 length:285 start_codon:yes stop_codon:yes gene_type:complete